MIAQTLLILIIGIFSSNAQALQCRSFLIQDYNKNPLIKVLKTTRSFQVEEESKLGPFFDSDFFFNTTLGDDNKLSIDTVLRTNDSRSAHLSGALLFRDAINHFGLENIKTIEGHWVSDSDNFHAYLKAVKKHSPSEAAMMTWTGQQVAKYGFLYANVTLLEASGLSSIYNSYKIMFSRDPKNKSDVVKTEQDTNFLPGDEGIIDSSWDDDYDWTDY